MVCGGGGGGGEVEDGLKLILILGINYMYDKSS